jgi:hypothetical protein
VPPDVRPGPAKVVARHGGPDIGGAWSSAWARVTSAGALVVLLVAAAGMALARPRRPW